MPRPFAAVVLATALSPLTVGAQQHTILGHGGGRQFIVAAVGDEEARRQLVALALPTGS